MRNFFKWFIFLNLIFILIYSSAAFVVYRISEKNQARKIINIATRSYVLQLPHDSLDGLQALAKSEPSRVISLPNLPCEFSLKGSQICGLSMKDLKQKLSDDLTKQVYNKEMNLSFIAPVAPFLDIFCYMGNSSSHSRAYNLLLIFIPTAALLLFGLVYFAVNAGRLILPGIAFICAGFPLKCCICLVNYLEGNFPSGYQAIMKDPLGCLEQMCNPIANGFLIFGTALVIIGLVCKRLLYPKVGV
ncbi:MAG: hypothetical protein C4562_03700 [Actinobacteria bacterium]|nr:MAG: hypothetical protein C4562_03700 [Actinomycetota bacterium]